MHTTARIEHLARKSLKRVLKSRPLSRKTELTKFDLDSYIETLKQIFDNCVASPNFLRTKPDLLEIKVCEKRIQTLCIELPTTEFLHLHSVAIFDENNKPISLDNVEVSVSSHYSNPGHDLREKLFNAKGSHNLAFHTKYESNPRVAITFLKPQGISRIIIKNRQDQYARRSVGIRVRIAESLGKWKTVYDLGGLDNFLSAADQVVKDYKLHKYAHAKALHKFVTLVIQGKDQLAVDAYRHIPAEFQPILRDSINRIVLDEKEIEWTSHGLRKSFRFWSLKDKRNFVRFSMQVVNNLTDLSADVCLGYGSVLAVVRDKDLIPHDDDMDIIIAFKPARSATLGEALSMVKKHLEPKGYNVGGDFFNYWHISRSGLKVDVFVGIYESDDTIGWYPYKRGGLKHDELFPTKKSSLLGVNCTVPRNPERYLEVIYGQNWRKPDPGWHPDWSTYKASYRDIAGK